MLAKPLLKNYRLIRDSDELGVRDFWIDLNNAIDIAHLTELEYKAIRAVYIDDLLPPERGGPRGGSPKGGSTRAHIAQQLGMCRDTLWKTINRATEKIDKELDYELSTTLLRRM